MGHATPCKRASEEALGATGHGKAVRAAAVPAQSGMNAQLGATSAETPQRGPSSFIDEAWHWHSYRRAAKINAKGAQSPACEPLRANLGTSAALEQCEPNSRLAVG